MKFPAFFSKKSFNWHKVTKVFKAGSKKIFFPQDGRFESLLKRYAIYAPEKNAMKLAPTQRLFDPHKMRFLSAGMFSRVYKMNSIDWVVKEGRWDMDFSLFGETKLPLPVNLTQGILKLFSYTFLPDTNEILRQYKGYLKFIQYFGYFKSKEDYYHPNLELISNAQKNIRDSLSFYMEDLETYYQIKFDPKLKLILDSELKYHNFLPKEYLLVGDSIAPENKGKKTFFIVQKFVKGDMLHDVDDRKLPPVVQKQLVLLTYLILLMNYQIHIVPDTRPRYPLLQVYNWLTKTDNIIVNQDQVKFIDTRWFWDNKSNFIKRGLVIPEMIIGLAKNYINEMLKHVE